MRVSLIAVSLYISDAFCFYTLATFSFKSSIGSSVNSISLESILATKATSTRFHYDLLKRNSGGADQQPITTVQWTTTTANRTEVTCKRRESAICLEDGFFVFGLKNVMFPKLKVAVRPADLSRPRLR